MSFSIRLKVPNGISNRSEIMKQALQRGIARATGQVTNLAIEKAPRKTGTLKRSIGSRSVEVLGSTILGRIVQDETVAKYGAFVNYGTGIYGPKGEPIRPLTASFLVFKNKDGRFIRKKEVKGMNPRPFMEPALKESIEKIQEIMQEEINKALKEIGGS